jgi:hypothetical protein
MLVISLITLAIASLSAFVSLNMEEEVFSVGIKCIALLSLFLTLLLAPWVIKLTLVAILVIGDQLNQPIFQKPRN